ncbi:hypothetical protein, partial [Mesorhizobium sp.]|uniref:hypothetical protein n=1 Tax=Mesorhizobium sp. TaxID=1871066 RepID=UPI002580F21A
NGCGENATCSNRTTRRTSSDEEARMSAALLMPREPVHGRVCFGQTSQRLLDLLSRGVSALDVPDHLLP